MFDKIKLLFSVLRQGQELAKPEMWKNVSGASASLLSLFLAAKAAYGFTLPDPVLESAANAVAAVVGVCVVYWNYATSKKVGV